MATHRLFFALPITDEVRQTLCEAREVTQRCAGRARVTWVDPAIAHITLHFLGAVPNERVDALTRAADEAVAAWRGRGVACQLVTGIAVSGFPRPEATRTVVLPIEDAVGCAAALHEELRQRLVELGFPTDARPWSPHLTVGRVCDGVADLRPCTRTTPQTASWSPATLKLLESELTPTGPRYTTVASFPLHAT
jgi:2'-5' RNA ligase